MNLYNFVRAVPKNFASHLEAIVCFEPPIRMHGAVKPNGRESAPLASCIADMAHAEDGIRQRILRVCDTQLSPTKRMLLSKVIARLGTLDAVVAGLSLIDDSASPCLPYDLQQAIEAVFLERRPYGKTGNAYTLVPRGSNEVKAKLFEMALRDDRRSNQLLRCWDKSRFGVWSTEDRALSRGIRLSTPVRCGRRSGQPAKLRG